MRFTGLGGRGLFLLGLSVVAVAPLLMSAPSPAEAGEIIAGEIIIEATALHPEVLITEPNQQVRFINRSGHLIHLSLITKDPERHHVFQVPDQIWAIFHRTGRHGFEVHFLDGAFPTLRGAVEVQYDPFGMPDPLTCSGITVMGACIER
jgi:hypothetical protein